MSASIPWTGRSAIGVFNDAHGKCLLSVNPDVPPMTALAWASGFIAQALAVQYAVTDSECGEMGWAVVSLLEMSKAVIDTATLQLEAADLMQRKNGPGAG